MTQDAETPLTKTQDEFSLPPDVAGCHALLVEQSQALSSLVATRTDLELQLAEQKAYIERLLKQLYGRRSERRAVDPAQRTLDFGDDPAEQTAAEQAALAEAVAEAEREYEEIVVRRKKKKDEQKAARSEAFPAHYPREEVIVEPPVEDRVCPTHGEKKVIGYDTTETLTFERPVLKVVVRKYPKYVCEQVAECGVTQADRPTSLVEGNRFDTSIAAEIITNKVAYHIPLYREQDMFAGLGWTPSRSTLLNIMVASTFVVKPLTDFFWERALASGGLGCDDTHVKLITPGQMPELDEAHPRTARIREVLTAAIARGDPSITARLWGYRPFDVPLNVFDFTVSRHRDGPDEMLEHFRGNLMADCYSGFDAVVLNSDERIVRYACWAHARRKFVELSTDYPQVSAIVLGMIRELYDLEDRAKPYSADARRALRERESASVLTRLQAYLASPPIAHALPKSRLAGAANYLRNNWVELTRFVHDGRVPVDNNDVEQLMKQIATGRKNWLFVGSLAGGERAATLMTLVSSAHRNELDVWVYVKDVLDQLLAGSTNYESLLPHVWKQSHPEAIRIYRVEERRDAADRQRTRRLRRRIGKR